METKFIFIYENNYPKEIERVLKQTTGFKIRLQENGQLLLFQSYTWTNSTDKVILDNIIVQSLEFPNYGSLFQFRI